MKLERVGFTVKNFLCGMYGISYDYDLRDNIVGAGLVDTTPNCEQFCFGACHIQSMMDCFDKRVICYVNV